MNATHLLDPARFAPTAPSTGDARLARSWARNDAACSILRQLRADAKSGLLDDATLWAEVYSAIHRLGRWDTMAIVRAFAGDDAEPSGWATQATDAIVARLEAIQAENTVS